MRRATVARPPDPPIVPVEAAGGQSLPHIRRSGPKASSATSIAGSRSDARQWRLAVAVFNPEIFAATLGSAATVQLPGPFLEAVAVEGRLGEMVDDNRQLGERAGDRRHISEVPGERSPAPRAQGPPAPRGRGSPAARSGAGSNADRPPRGADAGSREASADLRAHRRWWRCLPVTRAATSRQPRRSLGSRARPRARACCLCPRRGTRSARGPSGRHRSRQAAARDRPVRTRRSGARARDRARAGEGLPDSRSAGEHRLRDPLSFHPVRADAHVPLGRTSVAITRFGLARRRCRGCSSRYPRSRALTPSSRRGRWGSAISTRPRCTAAARRSAGSAVRSPRSHARSLSSRRRWVDPSDRTRSSTSATVSALRSVEESLERLCLDRVDVLLIHDPEDGQLEEAVTARIGALDGLRSEGTCARSAPAMNRVEPAVRLASAPSSTAACLPAATRCSTQSAAAELLPLCERCGIAVVAEASTTAAFLRDRQPGAHLRLRSRGTAKCIHRTRRLEAICARHGVPLKAAADPVPAPSSGRREPSSPAAASSRRARGERADARAAPRYPPSSGASCRLAGLTRLIAASTDRQPGLGIEDLELARGRPRALPRCRPRSTAAGLALRDPLGSTREAAVAASGRAVLGSSKPAPSGGSAARRSLKWTSSSGPQRLHELDPRAQARPGSCSHAGRASAPPAGIRRRPAGRVGPGPGAARSHSSSSRRRCGPIATARPPRVVDDLGLEEVHRRASR